MNIKNVEDKYLSGVGDFRKSFKEFYNDFSDGFPPYEVDKFDPLGGRNKQKFSPYVLVLHKSNNRLVLLRGRYDPKSQTIKYPNNVQDALVLTCPFNFNNLDDWGNDIHFAAITDAIGITSSDNFD